ncbi:MAG: tRNA (adenosine(37)-N6)-threonylcarbamoyltransferase complex dimerization subunit type 1 TsaB [Alphaproteobacteria bacterium]|nr:tRNA (adenosine(37)-N6)-threonylcarbamoyltransferase complex dimerization subunit type 1 TsaB [Alphaproteobacteria bacterium]
MRLLVFDTCGASCAVGVWEDGRFAARLDERMARGQDARLVPMVLSVLEQAGSSFEALDRIAVTRGPGSFTGLRVGLAAARGMGFAAQKPVIGIDRFSAYAFCVAPASAGVLIVLESKRAELFCQYRPAPGDVREACLMTAEAVDAFLKDHPGTALIGDRGEDACDSLASVAALAAEADPHDPAFAPRPLYLRAADVSFPKNKA